MKLKLPLIGAVAALLLVAGCNKKKGNDVPAPSAPVAAVAAPNGGDWTQTVTLTSEGGYQMGNPNAAVKLVEYASYTCPHCREFMEKATQPLENDYVKSGRISWEFRPFMIFPTDPGISAVVRCHGPSAAFLLGDQLYGSQSEWVGKLQGLPKDQLQALNSLPPAQQSLALFHAAGLDEFFRMRGMPEARINSCLADQKLIDAVTGITERATKVFGVTGTPTFFINGQKVEDVASWDALEPILKRALGA